MTPLIYALMGGRMGARPGLAHSLTAPTEDEDPWYPMPRPPGGGGAPIPMPPGGLGPGGLRPPGGPRPSRRRPRYGLSL